MAFTFLYIVSKRTVPVFFLQICTHTAIDNASARMEANAEMRTRFVELADGGSAAPQLVGVCAMGTRFAVYVPGSAPKAQWSYDILDPAGEAQMREVVRVVKVMSIPYYEEPSP